MMMVIILVSVASYCASTIRLAHDTSGPGTPCGSTRDCGVFQSCVNRTTMLAVGACADRCGVCIHDGCWTVDRFRVYTLTSSLPENCVAAPDGPGCAPYALSHHPSYDECAAATAPPQQCGTHSEPVEMCTRLPVRLLGDADPWGVIETFCIVIFTVEFCLRLCSCSAGPGLLRFCSSLPNLIDLVAIVPWLPEA